MSPLPASDHRTVPQPAPSGVSGGVTRTGPDACPTALQVHAAADGGLARVRIPGGVITADQARVLARAARDLGDGHLDQTSRGNLQLRALPPGAEIELGARLADAGLLPSATHERARNIVASPLSGLDGATLIDVRPLIDALDRALLASPALAALSGRFLFALDDGRGDVAALRADVCLAATNTTEFALLLNGVDHGLRVPITAGANSPAPAGANSSAPAEANGPGPAEANGPASAEATLSGGAQVAGVMVAAAEAFLAERAAQGSAGWRMSEIDQGADRVAARLGATVAARLGATAAAVTPAWTPPDPPAGVITGATGATALAAIIPLGRISATQLDLLAAVAAEGAGELRCTPWRGVVIPGLPDAARLPALAAAGLAVDKHSPWYGMTACAGRPGCAKSRADVRADATTVALGLPQTAPGPLPVHWAGCERGCGHPATPHVRVLAEPGGYRVDVPGRTPAVALTDPGRLAAAVAAARAAGTSNTAQETGA
ncbi:precorrin-3B synthase [Catenuloplanes indicus]|uniref:Precorrin-3B synthase n=1 Tax=Catenuloplanes indicus TaxID=137267 RepID=A0AAE3W5G7_9ACTN|nr:precorrin-3B synthase [Catenuloplanes indicus]MDQ0370333.1 precorrin-3B synthase [Catenuloplanes indicus]